MFPPDTKILIVEDMNSIREAVVSLFRGLGFEKVHDCKDGAEAWEKMQTQGAPFELVICDLNMPNSNGMDLLNRIRASKKFKDTCFIMISSQSDQKKIVAAIQAGADYFVIKPLRKTDFAEKLKLVHERKFGSKNK
jgi:two-component system chemotaxis response regulator CheY